GPFQTVAEARQVKPQSERWDLFSVVCPRGTVRYTHAVNASLAVAHVAQTDGYRVTTVKEVDRGTLIAGIAQLSVEERAELLKELGAQASAAAPAAAPAKPTAPRKS